MKRELCWQSRSKAEKDFQLVPGNELRVRAWPEPKLRHSILSNSQRPLERVQILN
jgi:hypothetical protein